MKEFVKAETVPSNIKFRRVKINPVLAQKWLDTRNLNNRSMRKSRMRTDSQDMLAGRWYENGDVIRLAEDGELLDGVHRLTAIIQANCEITLWVAYGIDKAAMGSIDVGAARNFSDYLKLNGEHQTIQQAAIVRRLEAWGRGYRIPLSNRDATSLIVLRDLYWKRQDDIRNSVKIGDDIRRTTQFLRVTSAALFYILTADIDLDSADEFKDRILDGQGLSQNNPINALRRKLLSYGANDIHDTDRLAMFIHAWNFWRNDEPAETIYRVYADNGKVSSSPLTNQNFPEPK